MTLFDSILANHNLERCPLPLWRIKVTDEELLSKTGGIIQGMSGSPVIQNNKFIGAITNVLVNDPTQGYAVFGEMMLKELQRKGVTRKLL